MLFYLHGSDAFWLSILWVFIIPALIVALGVWLGLKYKIGEPPESNETKDKEIDKS